MPIAGSCAGPAWFQMLLLDWGVGWGVGVETAPSPQSLPPEPNQAHPLGVGGIIGPDWPLCWLVDLASCLGLLAWLVGLLARLAGLAGLLAWLVGLLARLAGSGNHEYPSGYSLEDGKRTTQQ